MSQALKQSLRDNIKALEEHLHNVSSSGLDFDFEQEQLSFQLEGLVFELGESIDKALKLAEIED